ncbi:MAG: YHS domain-containing (seleno)protein [Paraglaciecola sp.]|uniref:YHS domain-containing (seleno)protein n=1 Tax=Paraglaciecola sp. TaxID=1920173 RepID=UPI003262EC68
MRNLFKYLAVIVITFFTIPAFALDDAVNTGRFNNIAIDGYDTVAYFTESKPVKGNKNITAVWHDATWQFSSEENLALFNENPEKYAAQYGGWCAYGMSNEATVRIDPEAWHITDGKLYLNYSKRIQKKWLADKMYRIEDADLYYPEVTNVNSFSDK